ncbi:serine threonine kinase fnkB [Fusarium beomiforme]|uniref:Serine threonine kinase fnkB n=1 Tax=Fusarium beomiforme TaxID=44412 RepID=A0A9P5A508_9HYPO|nr:serine threonine kinase fnkB [Fusarium beomiforme]
MPPAESLLAAKRAPPEPCVAPYQAGYSLDFRVLETTNSNNIVAGCKPITANIVHIISTSKAVVMHVTLNTKPQPTSAILKLYDRRFGTSLRRDSKGRHVPCRVSYDRAFQSFVLRGAMARFLKRVEEMEQDTPPAHWIEGSNGQAKFEAALWRTARQHFRTEVEVYKRLEDIQGVLIPNMYATVLLATNVTPSNYFNVNGILLQFLPGCTLYDLPQSPSAPESQQVWSALVQTVVDSVYEINKRGIIMEDSGPHNVIFDVVSKKPFIVDFAECVFKDILFEVWEETAFEEGEKDWCAEREWAEIVKREDSSTSIGWFMVKEVEKVLGFTIDIKFPGREKAIEDDAPVDQGTAGDGSKGGGAGAA